eukprot:CAMPEP_0119271190 /NCGR_PEP_ID=MMETSP1329-20130426/7882_1 /TAXON_ID=114041 /ORGANISM="Genus nov. species nov., Strain RCC1024" /LENGTH=179 /DNA_ID=CAMNT_0007271233 /DNA_START=86 /DNA_END=621 /DNA_ORIENTATION=+
MKTAFAWLSLASAARAYAPLIARATSRPQRIVARPQTIIARAAAADDVVDEADGDEARLPKRPTPDALPEEVVAAQMVALAFGDVFRCFKFASPANKAVTGPWQRFERMLADNPEYSPMLRCSNWKFIGGLPLEDENRRIVRVRVYPAGGSSAPFAVPPMLDYEFQLSKQPDYAEDDER